MKGLMIKDLMCLRKQRILFFYVVLATVVISVMFVLSARFGNIAAGTQSMMQEDHLQEMDIRNLSTMPLIFFMLLPIAMVGDISAISVADGKAGFSNVSAILPLSIEKRVLAKYLTVLVIFGIGVGVDTVISFVLSILTDIVSFEEFMGIIISAASLMCIYGSLVIMFCFLLGVGKEGYAQALTLISMFLGAVLLNLQNIRHLIVNIVNQSDENLLGAFLHFIKYKAYVIFLIAILVMAGSYIGSVLIARRKRGII